MWWRTKLRAAPPGRGVGRGTSQPADQPGGSRIRSNSSASLSRCRDRARPPAPPPSVAIWRMETAAKPSARRRAAAPPPRRPRSRWTVSVGCPSLRAMAGRLSERRVLNSTGMDRAGRKAIPVSRHDRRASSPRLAKFVLPVWRVSRCGPSRPRSAEPEISAEGRPRLVSRACTALRRCCGPATRCCRAAPRATPPAWKRGRPICGRRAALLRQMDL